MEKKILVDNKALPIDETTTKFGFGQLNNTTPVWVKNAFKLTVVVTSVATFWVGATSLVEEGAKVETMLAIKAIDLLVLGVSRLFGVEAK